MQKLNVRFAKGQHLKISDLADALGVSNSDIARAALELGMNQIRELGSVKKDSAIELVAINAYKAKQ